MRILNSSDYKKMLWRNSAGITYEIASEKYFNKIIWRTSIAEVSSDSSFSEFIGFDRVLTIIDGEGLKLYNSKKIINVSLYNPVLFSGNDKIFCKINRGRVKNFNLIFDPKLIDGFVDFVIDLKQLLQISDLSQEFAIFCINGPLHFSNGKILSEGSSVFLKKLPNIYKFSNETKLLFINLEKK